MTLHARHNGSDLANMHEATDLTGAGRSAQLDRLLNAHSIAVVGASDDLRKAGGRVVNSLLHNSFAGKIYPINPTRTEIQGLSAYPSIAAVGEPIDLAIISVAAAEVDNQLRLAIKQNVGGFIVFASGFAEVGAEGAALQEAIARTVRAAGVPMIGPNCLGVMNGNNAMLASSTVVMDGRRLPSGNYGCVSQSGALGTYWLDMTIKAGLGVSAWISTGNEADVDLAACLEYLVEDDMTHVIGIYIEGVRDGVAFRRAARKAFIKRKPILVLKSGRSKEGATAAASHTGALAGEDASYQALFDQYNMERVSSLTEMSHKAEMLLTQPHSPGNNVVVISVSGGAGVLMTDAAIEAGLAVPELPAETRTALAAILPSFATPQNPIDLTAQIVMQDTMLRDILRAIRVSSAFDGLLLFVGGLSQIAKELADALVAEMPKDKPCAVVWQAAPADVVETVRRRGIPVYGEITDAVDAMALQMKLTSRWNETCPQEHVPPPRGTAGRFLVEHASKSLVCSGTGLLRPHGFLAESADEVRERAAQLHAPYVVKLQSSAMLHKSGSGGIALNLADPEKAAKAADQILGASVARKATMDGVLVEEMIRYDHEFLVGLRSDPTFGPMLVIGRGGINVELEPDVAKAFLPLVPADIEKLIQSLRCARLLAGYRGSAPCDIAAVAEAVAKLSKFYLDNPLILEIEINPLVIDAAGKVFILDALVKTVE